MFQKQKPEFYRYNGGEENVTGRKLIIAEWFLRNKFLLRKILIWVLAIFSISTFGYGLFGWTKYLVWDYWRDRDMLVEQTILFQNYAGMHSIYGAKDFRFGGVRVFRSAENKYDFVSLVANPNERWLAKISYKFVYSGGETDVGQTVLLPGIEAPIGYFGMESISFPVNPQMVVEKIDWQRLNSHTIPDAQNFIDARTAFSFDNFVFTRGSQNDNQVPAHRIEFDLFNDSAFGYGSPMFLVDLLSGGQTVGYLPLLLTDFRAGASEHIDLRTFLQITSVDEIRLHHFVDLLDESVYLEPGL